MDLYGVVTQDKGRGYPSCCQRNERLAVRGIAVKLNGWIQNGISNHNGVRRLIQLKPSSDV